jgi:hypothetical protein
VNAKSLTSFAPRRFARTALAVSPFHFASCFLAAGVNGDAVIAAEKARNVALVAADMKAVANLLSDDLRYVHSNGKLETKQNVLDSFAAKKTAYEWMKTTDLVADEVSSDVVVLSGKIDQRKLGSAGWANLVLLFQGVWRNESGTWRLVNLQTALPPAPAPKP